MKKINRENISVIFTHLNKLNNINNKDLKKNPMNGLFYLGLLIFSLAIVFGIITIFSTNIILKYVMYLLLISGQIILILYQFLNLIYEIKSNINYFKNPQQEITSRINLNLDENLEIVEKLCLFSKQELTVIELQIQHKIDSLEKRTSTIVGQIDKVGIFPSILALLILLNKPEITPTNEISFIQMIIWAIVFVVIAFTFLSIFINEQTENLRLKTKYLQFCLTQTDFKDEKIE